MSWWRTLRSRPKLAQAELTFFSWTTATWLLIAFVLVVAWSRFETSPSGFHMQGRLLNQSGEALAGMVVGYNYAWKGNSYGIHWSTLAKQPHLRKFPRVFESVVTNQDGLFSIDINKETIGYVTILGFWKDKKSFSESVWLNQRKIEVDGLPNRGHLMLWDGGVARHYEPGWRVVDAMFGWGSKEVEGFVMDTSKGNINADR